jgi:6-phospho-beta-glucosidase
MRLVILGGSGSATPELVDAVADWPSGVARRPPLTIVLQARSAEKLDLVAAEARRRAAAIVDGAPVAIEAETDRLVALEGADAVVDAVRIGGLTARSFDETFPRAFGIPGEETMGPGGFANAIRTVPALRPAWEDVASVAPSALLVNLTNPSGIVVAAAEREFGLRVLSMCDSPETHCAAIAGRLGGRVADARARYVGMNHCGWWVPETEVDLSAAADLATGQDREAVEAQGAVGAPYVRYYVHPDRILASQLAAGETRAEQLQRLEQALLAGYADGVDGLPRRGAAWYGSAVLPLLDAWWNGSTEPLIVGFRNGERLPDLPATVTTEGPVLFLSPAAVTPLPSPALPGLSAAILAAHAHYEELTVDALAAGAPRHLLTRALLANPLVTTWDQATGLVDALLTGPTG